jgi:hypothetical protein
VIVLDGSTRRHHAVLVHAPDLPPVGVPVTLRIKSGVGKPSGQWFTLADGTPANVENRYLGRGEEPVFLVCGGPSLTSYDLSLLRYCPTCAVNNAVSAVLPYFRPTFWSVVDGPDKFDYTAWQDPLICKVMPDVYRKRPKRLWDSDRAAPVNRVVTECPNVVYYARTSGFRAETWLSELGICWGNGGDHADANGVKGKRSVMLCAVKALYLLGFRRIYLLGVDWDMQQAKPYAFDQGKGRSGCKGNNSTYAQLAWRFQQLAPSFAEAGLSIHNCNPAGSCNVFPRIDYRDAVRQCVRWAADPDRYLAGGMISTANLYDTKWYLCECGRHQRWGGDDVKSGAAKCTCGAVIDEDNRKMREYQAEE